jgi:hypothetical protein
VIRLLPSLGRLAIAKFARRDDQSVLRGHASSDVIPLPRPHLELPLPDLPRQLPPIVHTSDDIELEQVWSEVVLVVVFNDRHGAWQEHGWFALGTGHGRWYIVGFAEQFANDLVPRLCTLPHFNTALLLQLLGTRTTGRTILWRKSEAP